MVSFQDTVAMYEGDTEFPGYNLENARVAHFWQISAEHLFAKTPGALKRELERLLDLYGKYADEAMYCFLGSEDISGLLESYDDDDGWHVNDENWKEGYLIADILYLNNNYPDELDVIWMNETRWGFWGYFQECGRWHQSVGPEAFCAVVGFLSGFPTLEEWIAAC